MGEEAGRWLCHDVRCPTQEYLESGGLHARRSTVSDSLMPFLVLSKPVKTGVLNEMEKGQHEQIYEKEMT